MQVIELRTPKSRLTEEIFAGLREPQKKLPAKLFYDAIGSELFERICELPEYYQCRTETAILRQHASDIARLAGSRSFVFEFGTGAGTKTCILLEALDQPFSFAPIDIAREALCEAAQSLAARFPSLEIIPICADFTAEFPIMRRFSDEGSRVAFFPGSTIGNFEPWEAVSFLRRTGRLLGEGGLMIVGIDLRKDPVVLERAYNDSEGVTAAFNLNVLARLNREFSANFDLTSFAHKAIFNEGRSRIEMHLISNREQRFLVSGQEFSIQRGETIHTESSYKYTPELFEQLAAKGGFLPVRTWTDPEASFVVYGLVARDQAMPLAPVSA